MDYEYNISDSFMHHLVSEGYYAYVEDSLARTPHKLDRHGDFP